MKKYRLVNTEGYSDAFLDREELVYLETERPGGGELVRDLVNDYPCDWELVEDDPVADQPLPVRGQLIQVRDFEGGAWRLALFDRIDSGGRVWCFSAIEVGGALLQGRLPNRALSYGWNYWRFIDWGDYYRVFWR